MDIAFILVNHLILLFVFILFIISIKLFISMHLFISMLVIPLCALFSIIFVCLLTSIYVLMFKNKLLSVASNKAN